MKLSIRALAVLAVLTFTAAQALADSGEQRIVVAKGRKASDIIIAVGTPVLVEGNAAQGIFAAGSTVTVTGTVDGDVAVIGGTLIMTGEARIAGNVLLIGSVQQLSPQSRIEGKLFASTLLGRDLRRFFSDPFGFLFSQAYDPFSIATRIFFSLLWFVLAMILIKLFPAHVSFACKQTRKDFWAMVGTGIVGLIGVFALLLLSIFLCLILVGVPLLIALFLFALGAWTFGTTVFFCVAGGAVARRVKLPAQKPLVGLLLAIGLWTLLKFVPVVSFFTLLFLMVMGLGITLVTHFGKGTPWFSRKQTKPAK